ncbi:DivIVA domain-containing protein [Streptomyces fulvorobeus]|uniref:DivIVA domain-containing protein n=1 Tax=Streptomyces fulvorobeus TaxID=284028 RepID=A0A7J0C9H9_9ACTN|nr:DivIVA domain-containing protein [Streptomyces fulvorobeus]GFM99190.1 DivIVA domain-containing protein [Streptomyces fulvorobeus]
MFWFLLLTMVVVVAAVTLAVVGGGDSPVLRDVPPERLTDPLPATRPVGRADVDALRLPMAARGYRMADVDEALARLGAELAERDARIAELESALAGAQATAVNGPDLLKRRPPEPDSGPYAAEEDQR